MKGDLTATCLGKRAPPKPCLRRLGELQVEEVQGKLGRLGELGPSAALVPTGKQSLGANSEHPGVFSPLPLSLLNHVLNSVDFFLLINKQFHILQKCLNTYSDSSPSRLHIYFG